MEQLSDATNPGQSPAASRPLVESLLQSQTCLKSRVFLAEKIRLEERVHLTTRQGTPTRQCGTCPPPTTGTHLQLNTFAEGCVPECPTGCVPEFSTGCVPERPTECSTRGVPRCTESVDKIGGEQVPLCCEWVLSARGRMRRWVWCTAGSHLLCYALGIHHFPVHTFPHARVAHI